MDVFCLRYKGESLLFYVRKSKLTLKDENLKGGYPNPSIKTPRPIFSKEMQLIQHLQCPYSNHYTNHST